jgi:L-asparaginase II
VTRFDDAFAPIAVATRSGFDESLHHGAGVAVGPGGDVIAAVGDPDVVVYPRSCLKPMQAQAMVELGLDLPAEQLAVACASHDATPAHLDAVRAILAGHGLGEEHLRNTPARPYGDAGSSVAPSSILQNCSGKHAAMLATCVANGWPTADYLEPDHPVQQAIVASLELLGCTVHHVGVDGCGAPTHAIGLRDLAGAFAALASNGSAVARAMRAHPVMVAGPERDVTLWMQAVDGLMAKEGAAGVMAMGLVDGRAAAFKIADGSDPARRAVTPRVLGVLGVDVDPAVAERVRVPVLGHGRVVGSLDALDWTSWSS